MSIALQDGEAYKLNPLYNDPNYQEVGDFTPFYITITLCSIFGFVLIILNVFFCWCSKHKLYWQDGNSGNRWIAPIWTRGPEKHPPLDLTELEPSTRQVCSVQVPEEYLELHQKRESDL